jgi:predicted amidohydrolase
MIDPAQRVASSLPGRQCCWKFPAMKQGPTTEATTPESLRIGVVQFAMKPTADLSAFEAEISFFIRTVAGYSADFVVFPEYVGAALMAPYDSLGTVAAIRELAALTPRLLEFFVRQAVLHGINVITGSLPLFENGRLTNVVYLCRRDGTWESQEKLHVTPSEVSEWRMSGGDSLRAFDTDCGRIGMLICYDVEFPELGRVLADQGVELLFVPFCTDSPSGYQRVRLCAQARAIENECYVIAAGSVGLLPGVTNMEMQYAKSAVFSPSDFAFPENAVVTEAESSTETILIADLRPGLLRELHQKGSVRNLQQRRADLVAVEWKG